jgi:hypothetical protein
MFRQLREPSTTFDSQNAGLTGHSFVHFCGVLDGLKTSAA